MLPPFDEHGNLPAGIHRCTIDERVERFGTGSPERVVETQELLLFVDRARRRGLQRLIVNGSFVTATVVPNDVDLIILPGPDYPRDQASPSNEDILWPFLQILVPPMTPIWKRGPFKTSGPIATSGPRGLWR